MNLDLSLLTVSLMIYKSSCLRCLVAFKFEQIGLDDQTVCWEPARMRGEKNTTARRRHTRGNIKHRPFTGFICLEGTLTRNKIKTDPKRNK